MIDKTIRRPISWHSQAATHVGVVRRINEDAIMSAPNLGLWAVADGMGGYEAGDFASATVVRALQESVYFEDLPRFVDAVEDVLLDVNQRIRDYADEMLGGRTLGSTVVALMIRCRLGVCLWAGDSRLYCFRGGRLIPLTRDHSHVGELVRRGVLRPEEAENHPQANVITRAVGAERELYLDANVFSVQPGDTFVLCSDGLYNAVSEHDLVSALAMADTGAIVNRLVATALANGARDNVSVIVVRGEVQHSFPD